MIHGLELSNLRRPRPKPHPPLWQALCRPICSGRPVAHLTLLGGGAFGNEEDWILTALRRALTLARDCALDVRLVSYDGRVCGGVDGLVREFAAAKG